MMGFLVLFLHDERGFSTAPRPRCSRSGRGWRRCCGSRRPLVGRLGRASGPCARRGRGRGALALVAVLSDCADWILVPALVWRPAVDGLERPSFTIAAEIGGRRSGAAIGFQQTALSAVGVVAPVVFAATVSRSSWPTAFALAAVFPLAGVLACLSARGAVNRVRRAHAPLPRPDAPSGST